MSLPKGTPRAGRRKGPAPGTPRALMTGAVLIFAVSALTYAGVRETRDPRLTATVGDVSGIVHTSRAQIVQALALPRDQNAWLINRRVVANRIHRLPWVQTARVWVRWPNKLQIVVSERRPAAFVVLAAANAEEPLPRYALIDEAQRVLALTDRRSETQTLPLLLITPAPAANVQPGSSLTNKEVNQALQALERLRGLGLQVSQVAIAPATGISATADRNLHVLFGDDEDLAKKAAVFQAIVAKISEPSHIAYIDVRSVHAPTVLYR